VSPVPIPMPMVIGIGIGIGGGIEDLRNESTAKSPIHLFQWEF